MLGTQTTLSRDNESIIVGDIIMFIFVDTYTSSKYILGELIDKQKIINANQPPTRFIDILKEGAKTPQLHGTINDTNEIHAKSW